MHAFLSVSLAQRLELSWVAPSVARATSASTAELDSSMPSSAVFRSHRPPASDQDMPQKLEFLQDVRDGSSIPQGVGVRVQVAYCGTDHADVQHSLSGDPLRERRHRRAAEVTGDVLNSQAEAMMPLQFDLISLAKLREVVPRCRTPKRWVDDERVRVARQ